MTARTPPHAIDPRALSLRLTALEKEHAAAIANSPDDSPASPLRRGFRRARAATSSHRNSFPSLPRFAKSDTLSSTESDSAVSSTDTNTGTGTSNNRVRGAGLHTHPIAVMDRGTAEGEFTGTSAARARNKRSRSSGDLAAGTSDDENGSAKREFQYYGRHSNQWLFNDFSVKKTVRKGFGKVFGGRDGE